ncbi:MAG TPA: ABC transporter ATP-binding protein [Burkholderiaceae bacterium]|jgi:iron(III) transport system ATP-binding protein
MNKVGVQCRDLCLSYGSVEVLKSVSLDIEPGEFFALLGPSGSGKSSLLRLVAGFLQAKSGRVLIDGSDVGTLPPWQRRVGMVFQSYALWPHLSVWDNVAFGLVERRLDPEVIDEKVRAVLDLVGLGGLGQRRPGELSGGQQQRVALARTLVIGPRVLLLDEPLSNLDRTLRVQMRRELLSLQRRLGLTTLFVTHDQEEAMSTADRMAVLDQGVIQQVGTPASLYDYPVNAFVANFVGTMNILPARVRETQTKAVIVAVESLGELRLPRYDAAPLPHRLLISFRPHTLRVEVADAQCDARFVWVPGVIEASEFLGPFTRYRIRVGDHCVAADHPHLAGLSKHAIGSVVQLGLDPTQLRLLPA